jgi:hypothetical protein
VEVDALHSQVEKHRKQASYLPIVIKEDLTPGDLAFIESHRVSFLLSTIIASHDGFTAKANSRPSARVCW